MSFFERVACKSLGVIAIVLLLTLRLSAQQPVLTEYQTETIESIREITLQLILIAMGVFALLGGFLMSKERKFMKTPLIWISFFLLGGSVIFGLFTYGNLIWVLGKNQFDPFGSLRILAAIQWIMFGIGGFLFAIFVILNINRGGSR